MAEISVVLGSYQSAEHLAECMASLLRQSHPPDAIVVVDAASSDESADVARALGATVIETHNRGLGFLYNTGIRATEGDYVFVANTDIALDDRCLELLAAALDEDGDRFAADPKQLDWPGDRVVHARVVARRTSLLAAPIPGLALDPHVEAATTVPTVSANAGAMLLRRAHLEVLGGFDEGFFLEYEDLDLCWRARARGWESVYVPGAVIRHHVGGSTTAGRASRRRLSASHTSLLRFALKCLPPGAATRVVAGELVRMLRHPLPVGSGLVRSAAALPEIVRERRKLGDTRVLFERVVGRSA
jgi:GT2 family glycosyltransferase